MSETENKKTVYSVFIFTRISVKGAPGCCRSYVKYISLSENDFDSKSYLVNVSRKI